MPTVSIFVRAFRHVADAMKLPRVVVTQHPMGRPLGAPGDVARQREVLLAALRLLQEAQGGGSVVELPDPYRVPRVNN